MKQRAKILIFGIIVCCFQSVEGVVEVIEKLTTTSALFTGASLNVGTQYIMPNPAGASNIYVGWVWFPKGFKINAGGDASMCILPPVSGEIDFNDRTLTLTGDLWLASNATIKSTTAGKIAGTGNSIILSGDLDLNTTLTFDGDTVIDGNNNILALGTLGKLSISNSVTVTLKNIILNDLSGTKIQLGNASSKLVLDNTAIWLNGDYSFSTGSLFVHNDVIISGSGHTFTFNSNSVNNSYITRESKFCIDNGVTFNYNATANSRLKMIDDSSEFHLNGCTLYASNANGITLTNGTVKLDGMVTLGSASGSAGIIFNNATTVMHAESNAQVYGYLELADVFMYGAMSQFILMDAGTSTVNLTKAVTTFCDRTLIVKGPYRTVPIASYSITDANQFLCKTVADLDDWIDHGPDNVDVIVTSTNLIYDLWLSQHHLLNITPPLAGTTFDGATHFIHCAREDKDPSGLNPVINISGGNLCKFTNVVFKDFVPRYINLSGGSTVLFDNGTTLEMTNNVEMDTSYTMSCKGNVTINCFGNALDLTNAVRPIEVFAASTLTIQNATILGLSGQKIKLDAIDSVLTFSNCKICLSGTYNFPQGSLNFYDDNIIEGANIFDFSSGQALTINKCSKLQVDFLTTFSYGSTSRFLFNMIDKTSKFFLNGCTFTAAGSGITFEKGTIIFDHVVDIKGATPGAFGSITFGDNSGNDADLEILPGATIIGSSGYLQYSDLV
jgi:hypothetical protein